MNTDDAMIVILMIGIVLCCIHFRSSYKDWRDDKFQRERRRRSARRGYSNETSSGA
jgi:hypothetical protein